jgi:ParB-like chromosome segregation protein Spo0J
MDQKIDWQNLKANPAADLFPRMVASDLESLANSIKRDGQKFPIILYKDGSVLDGRNRLAAFGLEVLSKVEPQIETYNGELSPVDYVRVVNWERMHLSPAQRTHLAVLLLPEAKRKAATREKAGTLASSDATVGKAAEEVAEVVKVSSAQVERGARIQREAPEGFDKLGTNETTVHAEYAKLPKKKRKTPRPMVEMSKPKSEDGQLTIKQANNQLEKLQEASTSLIGVEFVLRAADDFERDLFVDAFKEVIETLTREVASIEKEAAGRKRLEKALAECAAIHETVAAG